ncbi:hypothetical protein CCU68_28205 [Pseudomonas gingeri NCPPB 3146 = LMG 5327]|uniref:Uncharacterized protein n=2 Tax=Pseudomonas gingeri TaxID=117681 RepID=A0A7Y7XUA5_9PSED|nr:hypothetical protein [Pseudomonas gingeri]NWC12429.1 hypothetical protein [Pseudomonas gingeri]PNQ89186.1 hypothetical protein CCU68_28205 [Pseudomonas gingeri NCPPB 3146 = LMG 5327]
MIADLYSDEKVFGVLAYSIEEEGVSIELGSSLLNGDEVDTDKAIIMKPDLYYSTKRMKGATPKSADGIVFVADGGDYHLYVAELKSSRLSIVKKSDIKEKFDTVFQRFFVQDFSHVFDSAELPYNLVTLNVWLVCDPMRLRLNAVDQDDFIRLAKASRSKMRTLLADYASGFKPYVFKGVVATVQPMLSPPIIEVDGFTDLLA